ncbi:PAS domain S-box protein [Sulfuricurvum sp. RIFCSPLOWO2_12_FULL_43_24]|uniref:sensor histidine kinase n=1 Tax=Sulfuricurvum sp. RIFCSPLOWO2_12_FULL_43_24 TaxID=1802247 RepID=UPI0008D0471C|nr:PAS domain S-box protein [Sulfuricurvum sp. RIFCSPLOWO2_12_FULL_43_24]OHD91043.1 MAG: hypothetical protein A3G19_01755 [Sulfuricurvum sp. RIFCSPLOWO2_12_FULL_43_24]
MKKENIIFYLIGVWIGILILSSIGVWLLDFSNSKQSVPIHATVEASGSIIALFLAFFLFKFDNDSQYLSRYHFASIALIAMGIFELFHAISLPGSLFVWLHTIGLLLGSILFLSVFLPEKKVSRSLYYGIPIVTAIATLSIAIFLLFNSEILPSAIVNGNFSTSEIVLNDLSGFLFFAAAYSFIRYYRMEQEPKDLYFIGLTIMLGSAAFLFQNSAIWKSYWWYWHFIRLGGLLFVLLYFIRFIAEKNKNFISREIQSSIVEFSTDAIMTKSLDGMILSWNAAAEKLFGYTAEEIIGNPIMILYQGGWVQQEDLITHQIVDGASFKQFETVFIANNGSNIDVSVTLSPIKDSNGEIIGISKIVRDITEKKRAEDQIHTLNAELERKVVERTAALQSAYDEMEAFTYSVSHDLRSPLRATDGFSQALLEDYGSKLDATAQDYLSRIRSASQKMGGLIDDLLQLSRQTRTSMVPSTIDLGVIARQIISELVRQNPERHVEVIIGNDLNGYVDANLMHIALDNLLGNAWKYTSQHPTATIEFGSMTQNGEKVFFIRDNGAGFDMSYVDKLFKPFQRLHTVEEFAGNGIGLAMVYRIIKRHLGRVWAESEIEKGSTFFFVLGLSESTYKHTEDKS